MSDPRVTVELLARADLSLKATLTEAYGKQWQDVLNDAGFGKCTLQNDDPDLALVEYGDFLRFNLDGVPRFMSIVEQMDRVHIAPGEEVDEATDISGRGSLAYLEDAVVYPDIYIDNVPFGDARYFNFGALAALDTAAGGGYANTLYDWGPWTAAGIYTGVPTDMPDPTANWVGPQAPDGFGNNPVGDWYYAALWLGFPTGRYSLYIGVDDAIDLYIDDVPIVKIDSAVFAESRVVDLVLDGAVHWVSAKVTNTVAGGGPTGLIMNLVQKDPATGFVTSWWTTDPADPLQFNIPYPATEPGVTVGYLMNLLIDGEAQAATPTPRGAIPLLTQNFTNTVDSNGVAWAEEIQPSFQIGTDYLGVIKQLCETYVVARMDPSALALSLYQTFGAASPASFEAGEDITTLRHTGVF